VAAFGLRKGEHEVGDVRGLQGLILREIREGIAEHFGFHSARGHGEDAYADGAAFVGQAAGPGVDPGFGRAVGREARERIDRRHRGDVDDHAAALSMHDRPDGTTRPIHSIDVDGHDGSVEDGFEFFDDALEGDAGVVDQNIDPSEALSRRVDQGVDIFSLAQVGRLGEAFPALGLDQAARFVQLLDGTGGGDDLSAGGGESLTDRPPDSAPSARNNDDFRCHRSDHPIPKYARFVL